MHIYVSIVYHYIRLLQKETNVYHFLEWKYNYDIVTGNPVHLIDVILITMKIWSRIGMFAFNFDKEFEGKLVFVQLINSKSGGC